MNKQSTQQIRNNLTAIPPSRHRHVKTSHIFRHAKQRRIHENVEIPARNHRRQLVHRRQSRGEDLHVTPWVAPPPDGHFPEARGIARQAASQRGKASTASSPPVHRTRGNPPEATGRQAAFRRRVADEERARRPVSAERRFGNKRAGFERRLGGRRWRVRGVRRRPAGGVGWRRGRRRGGRGRRARG